MPVYQADQILLAGDHLLQGGWVSIAEDGTILETGSGNPPQPFIKLEGILIPGFVNAHCHLELSYLRQRIAEKTGMTGFISSLMKIRNESDASIQSSGIEEAYEQLHQNGIVAVGDISNTTHTANIKHRTEIRFHTFIELMGLASFRAVAIIAQGKELQSAFNDPHNTSGLSPHAPYSVSAPLMDLIASEISESGMPATIHLQESLDELEFCAEGKGPMADFFRSLGIPFDDFPFTKQTPIRLILPKLRRIERLLFIHNTFITKEDVIWAESQHEGITWCLCPKANLYITGNLPPVTMLQENARNIAIGTDSLASNDRLDILDELKVLAKHFPSISTTTLLQWATINGAKALNMEDSLGSIKAGKKPGLLLLKNINADAKLTPEVYLERLH